MKAICNLSVEEGFNVNRIMVWPGQALSYKIGQTRIEELREKYKKQLGKIAFMRNMWRTWIKVE
jgi:uncharacterized protein (DUF885 family)